MLANVLLQLGAIHSGCRVKKKYRKASTDYTR